MVPYPYPAGDNPQVRGLKKVLMILGIIAGFTWYLVPGFFGIRSYLRWKRGEIPPPTGWMVLGVVCLALYVVAFLALAWQR